MGPKRFVFTLILILGAISAQAFQVPPLVGPVMDQAEMIAPDDEARLGEKIRQAYERGHIQLQILTVRSLEETPIEDAAYSIVKSWKLGTEKADNGVLLLVAEKERRMRIEVGQGLEGALPDIYAKRIVSDIMIPFFRRGETSEGILAGADQILRLASEESGGLQASPDRAAQGTNLISVLFFIAILFLFSLNGRRRRSGFLWMPTGSGGWGSRGSGWSGGGGGFSGGGASGSW